MQDTRVQDMHGRLMGWQQGPAWRRGRAQRGAAVVEFALVAVIYLLLLVSIVELGLMFSVNLSMQYAVREGARYAVVGRSDLDPDRTDPQRYRAVVQKIKDSSMGFWPQVSPVISVSINGGAPHDYAASGEYVSGMFGNSGDIVALQLKCSWPLVTPLMGTFFTDGIYRFTVGATMRNEGFQ